MTTIIPLNHDPHVSYDDLKIMWGYCGEWNGLYSGLEPKKLLGHKEIVGLSLWAKGKVQKETIRERVESCVIMLKTELDTMVNLLPWKRNALAFLEHG